MGNPELAARSPKKRYRDRLVCGTYTNGTYSRFLLGKGISRETSFVQTMMPVPVEQTLHRRIIQVGRWDGGKSLTPIRA